MIASYKMQNVEVSDARVLRMHEVLLAIKLVKFYVWERSFARQVEDVSDSATGPGRADCASCLHGLEGSSCACAGMKQQQLQNSSLATVTHAHLSTVVAALLSQQKA